MFTVQKLDLDLSRLVMYTEHYFRELFKLHMVLELSNFISMPVSLIDRESIASRTTFFLPVVRVTLIYTMMHSTSKGLYSLSLSYKKA